MKFATRLDLFFFITLFLFLTNYSRSKFDFFSNFQIEEQSDDLLDFYINNKYEIDDYIKPNSEKKSIYLLPKFLLYNYINEKSTLDLNDLFLDKINSLLIKNPKLLFIFNNTKSLNFVNDINEIDLAYEFIINSLPFKIYNNTTLIDFYFVIHENYIKTDPNSKLIKAFFYKNKDNILKFSDDYFFLFKKSTIEKNPLIVFIFNNSKNDSNVKDEENLNETEKESLFFDNLAVFWTSKMSYLNLINSIFCSLNCNQKWKNYCIKLNNGKFLHIFPFFFHENLYFNQKYENNEQEKILNIIDKFSNRNFRNNSKLNIDERVVFKPYLNNTNNDTSLFFNLNESKNINSNITSTSKLFSNLLNKLKKKTEFFFKKLLNFFFNKSDQSLNLKSQENLEKKKFIDFNSIDHPSKNYLNKRSGQFLNKKKLSTQFYEGGIVIPLVNIKNKLKNHFINTYTLKKKTQPLTLDERFKILQDSHFDLTHKEKVDNLNNHNTNQYNNKFKKLYKRFLIFSNDSNCEKITWYNIFHHSIFGKPKFCVN